MVGAPLTGEEQSTIRSYRPLTAVVLAAPAAREEQKMRRLTLALVGLIERGRVSAWKERTRSAFPVGPALPTTQRSGW